MAEPGTGRVIWPASGQPQPGTFRLQWPPVSRAISWELRASTYTHLSFPPFPHLLPKETAENAISTGRNLSSAPLDWGLIAPSIVDFAANFATSFILPPPTEPHPPILTQNTHWATRWAT